MNAFLHKAIAVTFLAFFLIVGCDNKLTPEPKNDPNVYCRPYGKESGEIAEYEGVDGKMRRNAQYREFKTASGFRMRVPAGAGGLGSPNKKCEMRSGTFEFRWANGKLMPSWDYRTGKWNREGSMVKYFVRFQPPEENLVKKFDYPDWMFEGAVRMPGYNRILILPFADYGNPGLIPSERNNPNLWRPRLLLEDARDPAGNSISFTCSYFVYEKKDSEFHVVPKNFRKNVGVCMSNPAFASGAGGRLDIYDEDFLGQGAAITNAVIKELNSYIIRE